MTLPKKCAVEHCREDARHFWRFAYVTDHVLRVNAGVCDEHSHYLLADARLIVRRMDRDYWALKKRKKK